MNKINIYYIYIYILTNPVKKIASQSDIFFHLFLLFHRAAKLQSVLRVFVLVVVPFAFSDFDLLSLWKEVSIWKPNRVLHLHLLVIVFSAVFLDPNPSFFYALESGWLFVFLSCCLFFCWLFWWVFMEIGVDRVLLVGNGIGDFVCWKRRFLVFFSREFRVSCLLFNEIFVCFKVIFMLPPLSLSLIDLLLIWCNSVERMPF